MHANNKIEVIDDYRDVATQETLVVLLATGNDDDGKRATLAFTAATCAAAMDKRTVVFMVGDGAHWAYEGRAADVQQKGFPPLQELMDCLIEMDGEMYVCSTCDEVCSVPSDDEAEDLKRHPQIQPRGMSAVLSDITDGRAVTF
jgi:predicted peroxiredoxin